jgi:hypothetical protein
MSKKLYSLFVIGFVALAALFTVRPAMAAPNNDGADVQRYRSEFQFVWTDGVYAYVSSQLSDDGIVVTPSENVNYGWRNGGVFRVYRLSDGFLVYQDVWDGSGHSHLKAGGVVHNFHHGFELRWEDEFLGAHTYRSLSTFANGEWRQEHAWNDGNKLN